MICKLRQSMIGNRLFEKVNNSIVPCSTPLNFFVLRTFENSWIIIDVLITCRLFMITYQQITITQFENKSKSLATKRFLPNALDHLIQHR